MEQNKVRNKIRNNYNLSEEGKKFIIHLIRNFLPLSEKAIYVTALPESNKPLKCCITGRVMQLRNKDTEKHNDKDKRISDELTNGKNNNCPPEQSKQELHVAMMAKGSNRLLCLEAAEQLAIFLSEEIINGNKHLKWVESDMQRKEQTRQIEKRTTPNKRMENAKLFSNPTHKKVPEKDIRDILRERKTEKTLLGDLSALQKIKEQFEAKEKESTPGSEQE